MLGRYSQSDYWSSGSGDNDSDIALRGGLLSNDEVTPSYTKYSRYEDPLFPSYTIEIDFNNSPLFKLIDQLLFLSDDQLYDAILAKVKAKREYLNTAPANGNFTLMQSIPDECGIYWSPTIKGDILSAIEWLFIRLNGIPKENNGADYTSDAKDDSSSLINEDIDHINQEIMSLQAQLNEEVDPWLKKKLEARMADLEEDRRRAISRKQQRAQIIPITEAESGPPNKTLDPVLKSFINSLKMFHELIKNHAYMISSVDISNVLKASTTRDIYADLTFTIGLTETVDMKMTRMMLGIFNALFDTTYDRELLPYNLSTFNMVVHVHDVRNFLSNTTTGRRMATLRGAYTDIDKKNDETYKGKTPKSTIANVATEHLADTAVYLGGCIIESFTPAIGNLNNSNITAGAAHDMVKVNLKATKTGIVATTA